MGGFHTRPYGHRLALVRAGIAGERTQGYAHQFTAFSPDVQLEAAAGPKALDRAVRPGLGQGPQQFDLAGTALQEHLGVADLIRRQGVARRAFGGGVPTWR